MTVKLSWIKSAGGPLICVESDLTFMWSGNKRKGTEGADYDRACLVSSYLAVIPVGKGDGLILGDMPLATTILKDTSGVTCLVRAVFLDSDGDVVRALQSLDLTDLEDRENPIAYHTKTGKLVIFDAALAGNEIEHEVLRFQISAGPYRVTTHTISPTERVSLIIHRFYLDA